MSWRLAALMALGLLHLGCANPRLERARANLYTWRVRLRVEPRFALEGDEVTAWVPIAPHSPQAPCTFYPEVVREGRSISIRLLGERPCKVSAEPRSNACGARLGVLPAGEYLLRMGALEHAFTVHPPGTPVGPVPLEWRVRIAVVQEIAAERCWGDPPFSQDSPVDAVRRRHQTLFRQVRELYPKLSEEEVAILVDSAFWVHVRDRGQGNFEYTITDGLCCERCNEGRVRVRASGEVEVTSAW